MDQDFHYYGTFYAARLAGLEVEQATRIARAANFIDFMHEGDYGGYWKLVDNGATVATLDHPRYTFQSNKLSVGSSPEDGLWCSYHFTPGNYDDLPAPSSTEVHGAAVAHELPPFELRPVKAGMGPAGRMLNRPQSALSRALLADASRCAAEPGRLVAILERSLGGRELLAAPPGDRADRLDRFGQLLLGARAHVIADTWAHQDWSGIDHEINTYYDVTNSWGRQAIEYRDSDDRWKRVVLSALSHENLQAVPNGTSYLGHGWMGHFPDYSFVRYRYKPYWHERDAEPIVRENPVEYRHAFLELCSLFARAQGAFFDPAEHRSPLAQAALAISAPCEVADSSVCPRAASSQHWLDIMAPRFGAPLPPDLIDARQEPDDGARLAGVLEKPSGVASLTRYGTYTVDLASDLYLFQIAADYHFHFVKHWLAAHDLRRFTGPWSQHLGPLGDEIAELF